MSKQRRTKNDRSLTGQPDLFEEKKSKFYQDLDMLRDDCEIPGKAQGKLILLVLLTKIGVRRKHWDEDIETLARWCQIGVSTLHKKIRVLRDAGLLVAEPIGRNGRYRFQVIRSNLKDWSTSEWQNDCESENEVYRSENWNYPSENRNYRSENDTIYLQRSLQQKPPPSPPTKPTELRSVALTPIEESEEEDLSSLVREVIRLGVVMHGCVSTARESGLTSNQIRDLIAYYEEHQAANEWKPGALHSRLINAHPHMRTVEGWPPGTAKAESEVQRQMNRLGWKKRAENEQKQRQVDQEEYDRLERDFGKKLDALSADEQKTLAAEVSHDLRNRIRDDGAKGKAVRRPLLRKIEEQILEKNSEEGSRNHFDS